MFEILESLFTYLIVLSVFLTIMSSNLMHSISFLLLFFFESSIFLVILGVDYFPLIIVSIYLGAIAVLFLFVIMMLKIKTKDVNYKIMPFLLASVLSIFIIELGCLSNQLQFFDSLVIYKIFIYNNFLDSSIVYSDWFLLFNYLSSVRSIGISLYTQFFFYIFLFSIIFLVSMLGSILLAMNWFNKGKKQNYFSQISKSNFIEI